MQLTKHFKLEEFLVSQTAVRNDIDMTPTPEVFKRLQALAINIFEPLRVHAGRAIIISSGYRPPALNRAIGSGDGSQHTKGEAGDFNILRVSPANTCRMIIAMRLPFDQLILEFGRWVHVSYKYGGPQRGEVLTAVKQNGKTKYLPGLSE